MEYVSIVYYNQSILNAIILESSYFETTKAINSTLCTIYTQTLVGYVDLCSTLPTLPFIMIIYGTFITMQTNATMTLCY